MKTCKDIASLGRATRILTQPVRRGMFLIRTIAGVGGHRAVVIARVLAASMIVMLLAMKMKMTTEALTATGLLQALSPMLRTRLIPVMGTGGIGVGGSKASVDTRHGDRRHRSGR